MIICVTIQNEHLFPTLRHKIHAFRHQEFCVKQNYQTHSDRGLEFDSYDNPATVFLVSLDEEGEVQGISRLYPTHFPYMLEEVFPEYVTAQPLPKSDTVWESSRMAIAIEDAGKRRKVLDELILAHCEFAHLQGIESYVGIMPVHIFQRVWTDRGWPFEALGEPGPVGVAGELRVTPELLGRLREGLGIPKPILHHPNYYETLRNPHIPGVVDAPIR